MAIKKARKEWKFDTKKEALKKQAFLKNPDTYEVVRNRENGRFAKGWVVRKRKEWKFDTKKEALKKQAVLKNPDTYEVVQNRENGRIAKGWVVRKRK